MGGDPVGGGVRRMPVAMTNSSRAGFLSGCDGSGTIAHSTSKSVSYELASICN